MCAETLPGPSRRLRALFGAISVRIARSRFDPNPWAELALIFGWAIWVGRAYLNFDTRLWPHGADFPLGIEPLSIWITLTECGSCILWNGFINGGAPSFADLYAPILHPLAVIATLVWGVISGAKVTLIASLAMAGMAQWWIARTLGLGRVARLWSAAMAVAGGHLAGRMEMGMAAVVLSTAACSLALAGGLQLALRGGRAATVIFGVTLASSFLAGQGYLQLGFVLAIGPSFLVFLLDRKLRPQAKAKEFVMAAILATLLSGLLLIPVVHFLPHLGKEIDTGLRGTQPLGYEPLNLVIGDFQFYQNESLGKVVLPSVYMNYIGWIPVLLAALAFWLIPRERWRVLLFFGLAFVLLLCFTSTEFKHAMARWLPEIASMLRYPSLAAGLHIPILLGLASMGLDHLLGLNRPMIVLELDATSRYHVRLSSLLLAPALVWALMSVYSFGQSWLGTVEVASDVQELGRSIPAPGSAWVQPPRNTHVWPVPLIEQGFKVAGVFRPWHWKYRDLPSGSYQAILEGEEEPEGELVAQVEGVRVYHLPEVHYAFVEANSGKIYPCIAQAMGGKIDVSCNVPEPGRLIIQENTWTGWFAYLDGTRTPLQGDQWLEVAAPDGHHTFAFRYRPWDVALGAALTLVGILLCIHHLRHGRRHTQRIPQSEIGRPSPASSVKDAIAAERAPELLSPKEKNENDAGAPPQRQMSVDSQKREMRNSPWKRLLSFRTPFQKVLKLQRMLAGWITRDIPLETWLLVLAVVVCGLTRLIGLASFPIYFFSDEAVQTVLAADLVRDGFHGYDGVFLPTYFENASLFNLSLSVYLQVIPYLLFGKSVFVTRAVSVLIGMSGALAVGLLLRRAFGYRHAWAGVLVFSSLPAWFLHSRTAFETVIFVSMMAWVAYFYARYRAGELRHLYTSILFGALAFYSYRGGQLVILSFGALLFLFDIRHHWRHRRALLWGALLAIVLAVPYLRFELQHRQESYFQLRMLDTYWLHEIPLLAKLQRFVSLYLKGLSPRYWFWPNPGDLPRHLMKGYGHLPLFTLPFAALGLAIAARRVRDPAHRMILLLGLVSPLGGAMVDIGITRVLVFTLPAAILITLGLRAVCTPLARRWGEVPVWGSLFAFLIVVHGSMLGDALINGPTWYDNYGLGGMQYGARQVFTTVGNMLEAKPEQTIYVSPSWANGADILKRFFLPDEAPVHMSSAAPFLERRLPLDDHIIFVLTLEEYQDVLQDPKIGLIEVHQTIPYPNGDPGFVFLSMGYSEEADALFAAEEAERQRPRTDVLELDEFLVAVTHPYFDMGGVEHLFDEDTFTLARVHSANPARFRLEFSRPRPLQGIRLTTGSMDFQVTLRAYDLQEPEPLEVVEAFRDLPDDPTVKVALSAPLLEVHAIEIEILSFEQGDPVKIHLREIELW